MASFRPEPDLFDHIGESVPATSTDSDALLLLGDFAQTERPQAVEGRPHPPVSTADVDPEPSRSPSNLVTDLLDRARDRRLRAACDPCSPIDADEHAGLVADVLERALTNPRWR